MTTEQPTHDEKLRTYRGEETGWGYWISTPPVPANLWPDEDWIRFIGNSWFRKKPAKGEGGQ